MGEKSTIVMKSGSYILITIQNVTVSMVKTLKKQKRTQITTGFRIHCLFVVKNYHKEQLKTKPIPKSIF